MTTALRHYDHRTPIIDRARAPQTTPKTGNFSPPGNFSRGVFPRRIFGHPSPTGGAGLPDYHIREKFSARISRREFPDGEFSPPRPGDPMPTPPTTYEF